ncbi:PDC sensor domain-containing protein [Thiobacillus sedimenti]|uniref:PDC sensor domain-containing protein n=1 Tax=Thiobacillus sedimenti TaxID=3110231 RepID=A0ABZ1CGF3_9PROT|nr:PDC sensor domain-containing protein [Thiobacillus sp. SCUT-2]WRS38461.1 PDC sensor domain-containing protein [Thiobacillus sp. SCUT-2]
MNVSWKDSIYLQREALARMLRAPLARLAEGCAPAWGQCDALDDVLRAHAASVPHCSLLYCVGTDGIQVSNSVAPTGLIPGQFGSDRSQRPYMKEPVPVWGFLLSDAYIGQKDHRPSLTALQAVTRGGGTLGYVGANFDLRNLPVLAALYDEPEDWRQVKGDPAIRGTVFQQCRVESPLDRNLEQALSILEELLTLRGVFQCQVHFSSSVATIWTVDDPFRYRLLDHEALSDPDICLVYPPRAYPADAAIPQQAIARILSMLSVLRLTDPTIYLRVASINLFNGMVSATFSCDGSHYMPHAEFLQKDASFWF